MNRMQVRAWCAAALLGLALAGCGREDSEAAPAGPPVSAVEQPPAPGPSLPPQPPTSDPKVALQRMVAAYKKLDSLYIRAEADVAYSFMKPSPIHQSTILKYRKQPAGASLQTQDPVNGTVLIMAGEGSRVIYSGLRNTYVRNNANGDLKALARKVDEVAPQVLSPLAFLQSGAMPTGIGSVRMAGTANVLGKPTVIVKGAFTPSFVQNLGARMFGRSLPASSTGVTLWIDRNNYLLLKSSFVIAWRGRVALPKQQGTIINPRMEATEKTVETLPNPTFPRNAFRFLPPKDAKAR